VPQLEQQNSFIPGPVNPASRAAQHPFEIHYNMLCKEHVQHYGCLFAKKRIVRPLGEHYQTAGLFFDIARRIIFQPSFLDALSDIFVDMPADGFGGLTVSVDLGN
jgi:hypothetical protein